GHRQRDAVSAGGRVGVAGAGRRRGGAIAEVPRARGDRAIAVGGAVGEVHHQVADAVAEVCDRRHVTAATATAHVVRGAADDQLAAAAGQVIARAGAFATVVARGDVVEIGRRQLVQQRCREADAGALDRNHAGPGPGEQRRGQAGAAVLLGGTADDDFRTRVRIGVVGDVRQAAFAARSHAVLPARLRLEGAGAAAAAGPYGGAVPGR